MVITKVAFGKVYHVWYDIISCHLIYRCIVFELPLLCNNYFAQTNSSHIHKYEVYQFVPSQIFRINFILFGKLIH